MIVLSWWILTCCLIMAVNRVQYGTRALSSFKKIVGLSCDKVSVNLIPNVTSNGYKRTICFALKGNGAFVTIPNSSEGDVESADSAVSEQDNAHNSYILQADATSIQTVVADISPVPNDFPIYNGELDLDCPTKGFSSIPEAIEDIRQGKVCFAFLNAFL